jgi:predicted O-linked N-acetylglucosamine transferase (SPINDLY family)
MNAKLHLMLQQAIQAFQEKKFDGATLTLKKILQVDERNFPALHILGLIKASQFKYDEALDYLEQAVRIQPNDASINYNLAKALADSGNNKDALTRYKKAVALAPNNPDAWLNYGKTTSDLGHYEESFAHYDKALSLKPDYAEVWSNKGIALRGLKRYEEAIAHYDKALSLKPDYAEVWSNKGVALNELKRYEEAIAHYDQALSLKPDYAEVWSNKGVSLRKLKRYEEAIAHYDQALSLKPDNAEEWSNKGATLNEFKRYEEAIVHYDQALSLKPDYAEVWINKGLALNELKRYEEAIAHYDKALSLKPEYAEAWSNKGATLNEFKRYDEAIAHFDQALSLKPDYAEVWSNKGVALNELKRYDEAITHYDQALSLKPDYAEVWSNKGVSLNELKRYDEAITHYDQALSLKPDYAEAWSNKGVSLRKLKRYDEAIAHYDKALSLKPDYAEAWSNKGATLNELKRYDEAIVHYDKAQILKPDIDWVYGNLLHAKMKICAWSDLGDLLENTTNKVLNNKKIINPFALLSLIDDSFLHKKCAEIFIEDKYLMNPTLGPIVKSLKYDKIRLGYFSADFYNHATGYLMAELFELHDKKQFELVGFSFGPIVNDEMRQRLEKSFDQFIDVSNKSDIEIAQLSRDLKIDIAIDLKGFTQNLRTGIFANRASPIQVNYLGYPGTMGADYMDYIIADKTIIPVESQSCYSEKVVFLPNSYQVNDRKRLISERQFTRKELGLPETGFVFCCFNNNYKILPSTFEGWMRILKSVDGSVLWLFKDNPWVVENLKKEAQRQGIDVQRLVFAERMPLSEHLARHRQADLFLDTFPCNAHTTTSDALWTGLPVLTLMGESFASRVAASLLNAIGLPELITITQEGYEALAIELAINPKKLVDIKHKLKTNRFTTPLFDTPLFTKNLEVAYLKMFQCYQSNLKLDHIFI